VDSSAKRKPFLSTCVWRLVTATWFVGLMSSAVPVLAKDRSIGNGAPSYSLFGAFIPAWMFCALIGIFGAIAARVTMVRSGLAQVLPLQLFVCASIGLVIGLLAWLAWFGR
jgi:hypothetical protein